MKIIFKLSKDPKCCRFPLSEILNKVLASEGEELKSPLNNDSSILVYKIDENLSNVRLTYYKKITLKSNNYVLCCDNIKNQCIILENEDIVMIKKIYKLNYKNNDTIRLSVVKFLTVNNLFLQPVPSRLVGVFSVNTHHTSNAYDINVNNIVFKCFFVQLSNNEGIVISLGHNM